MEDPFRSEKVEDLRPNLKTVNEMCDAVKSCVYAAFDKVGILNRRKRKLLCEENHYKTRN